ncbi:hypothetical protein AEQ27_09430 [Frigoribacterium sp. RIT-PI-h]|nr:hypothetical protein AEQ27_09430 [Frigoribacterium sp. RIT-PI-h]
MPDRQQVLFTPYREGDNAVEFILRPSLCEVSITEHDRSETAASQTSIDATSKTVTDPELCSVEPYRYSAVLKRLRQRQSDVGLVLARMGKEDVPSASVEVPL